MAELSKIVDSLERNIKIVIDREAKLRELNSALMQELEELKQQKLHYEQEIAEWNEKNRSLKLANSLLGSNQHNRETKLKINALIREIDQCIMALSL